MAEEAKDTIYVDIDDEITSIIDKVQGSSKNLVALVLPKRAPVFGSIVNMKLLKRKSSEAKKNIVLVTTESGILPLAGAVGIHVAKTLASKPEIPDAPEKADHFVSAAEDEPISLESEPEEDAPADLKSMADEPVGKLSGLKEEETIELDNEAIAADADKEAEEDKSKTPKKDKDKKIPNFEKFRVLIFLGIGAVIIIIVLFILAAMILPKATIDVKTNAQNVNANLNFNLSSNATSVDTSNNTLPAKQVSETKTYSAEVNTTGQSTAQVATGSLAITAVQCPVSHHLNPVGSVPSGTTVSQGNNNYTTQSTVTFSFGTGPDGNGCYDYSGTSPTQIIANAAGSAANTSGATFVVANSNNTQGVTYSGNGSASGGADAAQVVAPSDISSAENKISTNNAAAKSTLDNQLAGDGYYPLDITFSPGTPNISPSTPVDGPATTVTVTETITYTLYGVMKNNLSSLIDSSITSQVPANQSIIDSGLSSASYSIGSGPTNINVVAKAVVGPNLNISQLKHKIVGFKSGQVQALLMQNANVKSVTVHFSPFFVTTVPSNLSHVTINVSKPS